MRRWSEGNVLGGGGLEKDGGWLVGWLMGKGGRGGE